jgi:hypothetical protein
MIPAGCRNVVHNKLRTNNHSDMFHPPISDDSSFFPPLRLENGHLQCNAIYKFAKHSIFSLTSYHRYRTQRHELDTKLLDDGASCGKTGECSSRGDATNHRVRTLVTNTLRLFLWSYRADSTFLSDRERGMAESLCIRCVQARPTSFSAIDKSQLRRVPTYRTRS